MPACSFILSLETNVCVDRLYRRNLWHLGAHRPVEQCCCWWYTCRHVRSGSLVEQQVAQLLLPWLVIQFRGFSGLRDGLHEALHFTIGSWPQWSHLAVFKPQCLCKVTKVFPIEQRTFASAQDFGDAEL